MDGWLGCSYGGLWWRVWYDVWDAWDACDVLDDRYLPDVDEFMVLSS